MTTMDLTVEIPNPDNIRPSLSAPLRRDKEIALTGWWRTSTLRLMFSRLWERFLGLR